MLTYPPVGVSTMAEQEQEIRRSHSEQDLVTRQRQQQLARAAEFYTAVGPDGGAQYQIWILFRIYTLSGKEIILRKYLEDQAGLGMEAGDEVEDLGIGFVSQALGHLEQEWGGRDHRQGQLRGDANFDFHDYPAPGSVRDFHLESRYQEPDQGYEVTSGFYDETDQGGDYSYRQAERERRDHQYYSENTERLGPRISPKHQIRSDKMIIISLDHHHHQDPDHGGDRVHCGEGAALQGPEQAVQDV